MGSRFDSLFQGGKKAPAQNEDAPSEAATAKPDPAPKAEPPSPAPGDPPKRRPPGRPPGKKSDPSFEQITAYVPRELYGRVRSSLWNDHGRKEFSALVAELLTEWLERQPSR